VRRAGPILLLLLIAPYAEAGPWSLGRGHLYAKLSYGYLGTTTLATPDGTLADIPRFTKHDVGLYAAYGIDDRLTGFLNALVYRRSSLRDFGAASGIGDLQAGVQAQLGRRGPWVFAVRGSVQVPTGDESLGEGLLPTGSGVWESEAVASVGRSLGGGRGWAFVEAGHQFRGKGLRDGFVYAAQVGVTAHRSVLLAWNVRGVEPYKSEPGEASLVSAAGLGDGVTYTAYGPTLIVKLDSGLSLQLDVDGAIHARNLAKGTVFRAGVSYSR